jgi:hypothetical protein
MPLSGATSAIQLVKTQSCDHFLGVATGQHIRTVQLPFHFAMIGSAVLSMSL